MEQRYTENNLVQFIYRDMEAVDYCELLFSLDDNPELNQSYEDLLKAKESLPKVSFAPSNDTMHMLLAYSQL